MKLGTVELFPNPSKHITRSGPVYSPGFHLSPKVFSMFSLETGWMIPASVIMELINSDGVTSKAGLKT